ncbi:hypothetical protein Emag_003730 [Eimeria magna]
MKTQTAALWLIAIGSAGVCIGVKLEDAKPFRKGKFVWSRGNEGGPEDTQPLLSSQMSDEEENDEEEMPLGEEVVDTTPLDTRVRSTLARVKGFFNRTALRRKAKLAYDLSLFAYTLQAKELLKCIQLAPQKQVKQRAQDFCKQFGPPGTQLRTMCLSTANEAQALMQAAADTCREPKTGGRLHLPLTHPMINRKVEGQFEPLVDPLPLPVVTVDNLHFNSRWEYLQATREIFITDFPTSMAIIKEVQNEMEQIASKATKAQVNAEKDRLFWRAWLLFVKAMQVRPHADPMLIRLLFQTVSFAKCTNQKVKLLESNHKFSEKHLRSHTMATFFAEALDFKDCKRLRASNNCKTINHYASMSKTLTKYYLPLNETVGRISEDTNFFTGGDLESAPEEEKSALYELIQEETHANVTFILEGADRVSTNIVDFIARSRVGRALIASVVSRILRYGGNLRHEQREEGEEPEPRRYKLLRSKLLLKATAEIESIVRQMYTYVMSGKKPLALVHKGVIYKVLLQELQEATARREHRQSLGQRSRRFFGFGKRQSFLQVEDTSALTPVRAHEAMMKNPLRSAPRRTMASFFQSDRDESSTKRNWLLIAGATFVFLGIAVLTPMATGALGLGLVVAGIVAMLISIVGKIVGLLTGTSEASPSSRSGSLAPPAQPPRKPEEAQPPQKPGEPEETEPPQEAEGSTEIGPDEEFN